MHASVRIGGTLLVAALATAARAEADWSIGAYGGAAFTHPSTVALTGPTGEAWVALDDVHFRGESLRSPIYYGYRIGHTAGLRGLWLEAELVHLKVIAEHRTLEAPVQQFAMSHGMNFILANVAWMSPARARSRVRWLARAGVGLALPHVEALVHGHWREGYQPGGLGFQVAPGLSVRLWRAVHATAEYKFTFARPDVDVHGGTASTTLRTHHGAFGVTAFF